MDLNFVGCIVLVMGVVSGIGVVVVRQLVVQGVCVVIMLWQWVFLQVLVVWIEVEGGVVLVVVVGDVIVVGDVWYIVQVFWEVLQCVDILVNVVGGFWLISVDVDDDVWEEVIVLNFFVVWWMIQVLLFGMQVQVWGWVINFSGLMELCVVNVVIVVKVVLYLWSKGLLLEVVGQGIMVNVIVLGCINSVQILECLYFIEESWCVFIVGNILIGCFGEFEEVVLLVVFLFLLLVGYIIGVVILVDGGMYYFVYQCRGIVFCICRVELIKRVICRLFFVYMIEFV